MEAPAGRCRGGPSHAWIEPTKTNGKGLVKLVVCNSDWEDRVNRLGLILNCPSQGNVPWRGGSRLINGRYWGSCWKRRSSYCCWKAECLANCNAGIAMQRRLSKSRKQVTRHRNQAESKSAVSQAPQQPSLSFLEICTHYYYYFLYFFLPEVNMIPQYYWYYYIIGIILQLL